MTRRVGVALLITELNVGGAERALTSLATRLNSNEFEVAVVSLAPRPEAGRASLAEEIEQAGVPLHFLDARSAWQAPAVVLALRRHLRKRQGGVVVSFLYHANVMGGLAVRLMKHGPTHIAGVRVAEPSRWRLRVERPFLRSSAMVTCVSEKLADYISSHQRIDRDRITVIPNGIDAQRFHNVPAADLSDVGIGSTRKLLTVVSRLETQKGIDWLLSDIDRLLGRLPEHDLLIVGQGSQEARLRALAWNAASAGRIHFVGQRSDIPAILSRSEMLLLPSRYEGMPNVVLEAMAAGLPIVATTAEGVEELLGENQQPQVVGSTDVNDFYDMAYRMAIAPQLQRQLGLANRSRVLETFTIERMTTSYANVIRSASNLSSQDL